MSNPNIKLIIGLGNPGPEFENTYHNAGLLALAWLFEKRCGSKNASFKPVKKTFEYTRTHLKSPLSVTPIADSAARGSSLLGASTAAPSSGFAPARSNLRRLATKEAFEMGSIKSDDLIWIKPLVFMNESGRAVAGALNYFKLSTENMLVIHDESDLAVGTCRFSFDSASAGHKGVQSIIEALGTQKFLRLRIGIRSPDLLRKKAGEFVLRKIGKTDRALMISGLESELGTHLENIFG